MRFSTGFLKIYLLLRLPFLRVRETTLRYLFVNIDCELVVRGGPMVCIHPRFHTLDHHAFSNLAILGTVC